MPFTETDIALYWLRDDLRLHDNEALHRAIENHDRVLPVYCFDPRHYRVLSLGFRKTSYQRWAFLGECLLALRKQLQAIGGNLLLRVGRPEAVLPELIQAHGISAIYAQKEIASEEVAVEEALAEAVAPLDCRLAYCWGKSLFHPDDLPFAREKIPLTVKTFRKHANRSAGVRELFPTPDRIETPAEDDWGTLPTPEAIGFTAAETHPLQPAFADGEAAALERLNYYTFESDRIQRYKYTRNRSFGPDYSSKLSAWLARGCLSPRQVWHSVKRYERELKRNISTWWLVFELIWRDFFHFTHWRFGDRVFHAGGYRQRETTWHHDRELFQRWQAGRTGIPFVDAHLRELAATGFMSNRGRVNCASFFTRDYRLDWRWGAAWFEANLLDYDVSSNWLNWSTQATETYYTNPVHQSLKYDKKEAYLRAQLPELEPLPYPYAHAPWLAVADGVIAELDYPEPVDIPKKWSRAITNIKKLASE